MNPLTNMKNVLKLSEQELTTGNKTSWHNQYRDSAWIFVGGLPYDLTEGDIICIFSQYGEIVNINLIRAKDTGKSKGFCFLCYEDQRSTILAVDNFNGMKILNRTIRVDHVAEYKVPKEGKKTDEETKKIYAEGCAPKAVPIIIRPKTPPQDFRETIADQIEADIKLPLRLPIYPIKQEVNEEEIANSKVKKEQDSSDSEGYSSSERRKYKKAKRRKIKGECSSVEQDTRKESKIKKRKKKEHSSKDKKRDKYDSDSREKSRKINSRSKSSSSYKTNIT